MKVKVCLFTVLILLCSCSQFANYSDYDPDNIANVNNGEGMDLTQFGKGTLYKGENAKGILNSTWSNYDIDESYSFFTENEIKNELNKIDDRLFDLVYKEPGIQFPLCSCITNGKRYAGSFKLQKSKNDFTIFITLSKEVIYTLPIPMEEDDWELMERDYYAFLKKYPNKYLDIEPIFKTYHFIVNEDTLILY